LPLVSEAMNRRIVALGPDASMAEALALVRRSGAEHVLVMDELTLVGILCACELRGAAPAARVRERMTVPPTAVAPDARLDDAVAVMARSGAGCVPVVVGGLILGSLSELELAAAGVPEPLPRCPRTHRRRRTPGRGAALRPAGAPPPARLDAVTRR
jgi:CBS domain-containing protein